MVSYLSLSKSREAARADVQAPHDPVARIEAALRSFDGRVPPAGSELHAAVAEQVRALRGRGSLPGLILMEMNEIVTTVVGYSARARARGAGLDALLEQVVRWSLDAYYQAD